MPGEFQSIQISELRESKANPRTHFDAKALEALAASIRSHGVLTPMLVRPVEDHYEIAAGHRRFRAAKAAGLAEVPAVVREMSDVELLEILVVENNQREDVHPIEEGRGYFALLKAGYSIDRLAERVSRSRGYVYDRLKLLELTKESQELFFEGKISVSHAELLSRLTPEDQKRAIGSDDDHLKYQFRPRGGLFVYEGLDDQDPLKPVSVRELASWIDKNVKLDTKQADVRELYPETAAAIEQAEKVVKITYDHMIPVDARSDERILTYRSWKRADGEMVEGYDGRRKKSKTCEVSVLGVIVIGPGRGGTFRVCVDKLCETHWGAEQREKAKLSSSSGAAKRRQQATEDRYKEQQARKEQERAVWKKAAPAIAEAMAEGIRKAPIAVVAKTVIDRCRLYDTLAISKAKLEEVAPKGKDAASYLQRACFMLLAENVLSEYRGPSSRGELRPFVDVAKILKEHAPTEKAAKS